MKKITSFLILLIAVEMYPAIHVRKMDTNKVCFIEKRYKLCYSLALRQLDKQPSESAKKFEFLCNEGNIMQACRSLAYSYQKGRGVRQDYRKALFFYKKTINANDIKHSRELSWAYSGIAELYLNGKGVKKDLKQAKEYFGKGCDLGDQYSCDGYTKLNN